VTKRRRISLDPFEADIGELQHDGCSLALARERVTRVYNALPGERVRMALRKRHRREDIGVADEVLARRSPDRVDARCAHYPQCSGCALQHLEHGAQLRFKQQRLLQAIQAQAGVQPETVLEPLTGPQWGYRRKARLGVRYVEKKGRVLVGFRERARPWVADLQRCEVLHPAIGEHLRPLADTIGRMQARDQIPQVEVAVDDQLAVLVVRHLQSLSDVDKALLSDFGSTHQLHIRLQSGGPDSIEPLYPAEQGPLLFENPGFDVAFEFEPSDFVQVNFELNRRMVDSALSMLDVQPGQRVLDLYCGLGNFTLPLARTAAAVVGVEMDAGLLRRAAANVERNGLDNVRFEAADLSAGLPEALRSQHFDRVLLDPPRSGAQAVLPMLGEMAVPRLVYVACSPDTLARDLGALVNTHGYALRAAGIMDMFPHTAHVESIALLEKN
jgi:23S rRNA (uracil1939-C5)-methyltransferase